MRAKTTWSIQEIDLLDNAGNPTQITDPAAISRIFGGKTTFTITD